MDIELIGVISFIIGGNRVQEIEHRRLLLGRIFAGLKQENCWYLIELGQEPSLMKKKTRELLVSHRIGTGTKFDEEEKNANLYYMEYPINPSGGEVRMRVRARSRDGSAGRVCIFKLKMLLGEGRRKWSSSLSLETTAAPRKSKQ